MPVVRKRCPLFRCNRGHFFYTQIQVPIDGVLPYNLEDVEPKFQSSFIPKGPIVSNASAPVAKSRGEKSLLGFLASLIFGISVLIALGVVGYKFYLNYSIKSMAAEVESGRQALNSEVVSEITRLNNRIEATETLVGNHLVLSPLFRFLEVSTLRNVRFTDFDFTDTDSGYELSLQGEARGYSALALQADVFNKSEYFRDPIFSDIRLDERGNVAFSFTAVINPALLSYRKEVEKLSAPAVRPVATSTATSTPASTVSTSSPQTATTTPR